MKMYFVVWFCLLVYDFCVLCLNYTASETNFNLTIQQNDTNDKDQDISSTRIQRPCLESLTVPPDFSTVSRRVNHIKCLEYLWDRSIRNTLHFAKHDGCYYGYQHATIGGRVARDDEFPHMAAIGWKVDKDSYVFKCGGSLISSRYVLTAAHCTRDARGSVATPEPNIVRLGENNHLSRRSRTSSRVQRNISRIIRHPAYSPRLHYHDIALLELESSVPFSSAVHPACLWDDRKLDNFKHGDISVAGWGISEVHGKDTTPQLMTANVNFIDDKLCNKLLMPNCYRKWCGLEDHQLCAGDLNGGVDTCQGDSGGPLQVIQRENPHALHFIEEPIYYVVGVTSFGFQCAAAASPGVYTRVSAYTTWIEGVVWPELVDKVKRKADIPLSNKWPYIF